MTIKDVEKIVTGFGTKRFAFVEYHKKGNFYYQISIDGKDIVFQTPSVNESVYEDSYLELEEFKEKYIPSFWRYSCRNFSGSLSYFSSR